MFVIKMNGKYHGRAFRQEGKLVGKMQTAFSASSNSAKEMCLQKNQMELK